MPLDVTYLDHVSVIITEIQRSRKFYTEVLGLKEMPKPASFKFVALWFDLGGQQLHLLQKPQPESVSPRHFALSVKDAEAARAYFRERGVATAETTVIPGCDRFFISDPDQNRIEIIQWKERYDPSRIGANELDR